MSRSTWDTWEEEWKEIGTKFIETSIFWARQLGCVFQDMKPPKSILRKGTDMPKPIQRVKFTKAIARHTKIRDRNPSLGYICPGEPHERSPDAPKFEHLSQEETEWQEKGAREAAWKLAKRVLKLKEHERATFFSPEGVSMWMLGYVACQTTDRDLETKKWMLGYVPMSFFIFNCNNCNVCDVCNFDADLCFRININL